jgi:hypothetical protein
MNKKEEKYVGIDLGRYKLPPQIDPRGKPILRSLPRETVENPCN